MTIQVMVLRSAQTDLQELKRYVIKNFGQNTWQRSYGDIKKAFCRISLHPEPGSVPDELAHLAIEQYRQMLVGMNRIIYETRGDVAYVHVICDTRQDLKTLLMRRILRA